MERAPKESAIDLDSTKRLAVYAAAALVLAGCTDDGTVQPDTLPGNEMRSAIDAAAAHVGTIDARSREARGSRSGDEAEVTLEYDGIRDDSVRAERHVVKLVREGDRWRVVSDRVTRSCREGRGHEEFTPEPCL